MRRNVAMSHALILVLALLVWLVFAVVVAVVPLLTKSSERASPPRTPVVAPAPAAIAIPHFRPRLALQARAAAHAPGELRLRISASGTFWPTVDAPVRLRVVLTAAEAPAASAVDRIIRRVALTETGLSAVFRHLRPGTWQWEVDAASSWTLALVDRASGRVAVTAPAPATPPPGADSSGGTTVEVQAPSDPTYGSSTTTSTPSDLPVVQGPDPTPTQGDGGGSNHPAAPFGGGGAPTPEGPHAP